MSYSSVIIGLGSVALALLFPPLAWHSKTRNTPAIILIVWLIIMDIKLIVDAAIWGGSDFAEKWAGYGWCDLMTKLQIGANVGLSCSVANIAYNLHTILRADTVLPEPNSWRKLRVDLSVSLITPIVTMGLSYVVQIFRFGIFRYNGCQNLLSPSWPTVIVYTMWMFLWSLVGLIYAILLLYVFYRKRKDVKDILHCTNSGLNLARFARLLFFCVLIILVMFPFSFYSFVVELEQLSGGYDFQAIHDRMTWNTIVRLDPGKPLYSVWLYILMSYLVFVVFGLGTDAIGMYAVCARNLGMGPMLDRITQYLNSRSEKRTSNAVSYFYSEQDAGKSAGRSGSASDGTSVFKSTKGFSDGSSFEMGGSTPTSPSHFIIDYLLPHEKARKEKLKRSGGGVDDLESISYMAHPTDPISFEDDIPMGEQAPKNVYGGHVSYHLYRPPSLSNSSSGRILTEEDRNLNSEEKNLTYTELQVNNL
ncbi:LANO_0G04038g1_1 [Lachancea nothofagi CBS 11611]|uniref:LANO_0G04038g1_1 n=1 Tax=Lachancea nothofagi CBS 11611 TaxID=1266666 RepID=A0A1G4KGC5_9SACH|nr:LANO_0G04038g1_1 [Lachancea nothofagi CBS 11611]